MYTQNRVSLDHHESCDLFCHELNCFFKIRSCQLFQVEGMQATILHLQQQLKYTQDKLKTANEKLEKASEVICTKL